MPVSDVSREAVERAVRDVIAVVLPSVPRDAMAGHRHLQDLGADSVDRVEIVLMLMDRLELDEPMSSFSKLPDIDSLVTFLYEHRR